jgi:hypothetical protein
VGVTPRWAFWARATLACAICGHWIANAVLDRGQYTEVGLEYTWRASIPILVQTALVMLAVIAVGPLARRMGTPGTRDSDRPRRSSLLTLLLASQLLLFLAMEVSERIVQREPFTEGLLASGFVFELAFAIGSALVLGVLGSIAIRIARVVRRRPAATPIEDSLGLSPRHGVVARPVLVVGSVRAPPIAPSR